MTEYAEALRKELNWARQMRADYEAEAELTWSRYQKSHEEFDRLAWEDAEGQRRHYEAEARRIAMTLAMDEAPWL